MKPFACMKYTYGTKHFAVLIDTNCNGLLSNQVFYNAFVDLCRCFIY